MLLGNGIPSISLPEDPSIVDGFWQVQVGVQSQITLVAEDPDNDDVTFAFSDDESIVLPEGATIEASKIILVIGLK